MHSRLHTETCNWNHFSSFFFLEEKQVDYLFNDVLFNSYVYFREEQNHLTEPCCSTWALRRPWRTWTGTVWSSMMLTTSWRTTGTTTAAQTCLDILLSNLTSTPTCECLSTVYGENDAFTPSHSNMCNYPPQGFRIMSSLVVSVAWRWSSSKELMDFPMRFGAGEARTMTSGTGRENTTEKTRCSLSDGAAAAGRLHCWL